MGIENALSRKIKSKADLIEKSDPLASDEIESVREDAFKSIILSTLNERFLDHLDEVGFGERDINSITSSVAKMPFNEAVRVFGIPASIAVKRFQKLYNAVSAGEIKPEEIPTLLLTESKERGFGIGYHNSPREIKPDPKTGDWYVRPTEKDHRDDDLPRAYYATSYKTLYRSKHTPRFLYIVRTIDENSKTDGNWSRSNALSIIEEVPLDRIDKWVQDAIDNRRSEKTKGTARESSA